MRTGDNSSYLSLKRVGCVPRGARDSGEFIKNTATLRNMSE